MLLPLILTSLFVSYADPGCIEAKAPHPPKLEKRKLASASDMGSYVHSDVCEEMKPGDYRVWQETDYDSFYSASNYSKYFVLRPPYTVQRTGKNSWKAILHINFQDSYRENGKVAMTADQMWERVNRCWALANPHMKGPNGEGLTVVLLNGKSDDIDPRLIPDPGVTINFRPEVSGHALTRSDANNYAVSIDCPTIIHETLHRFGLMDEYRERTNLSNTSSCRPYHDGVSIMSFQWDKFRAVVGQGGQCELMPAERQAWESGLPILRKILTREKPNYLGQTPNSEILYANQPQDKEKYCTGERSKIIASTRQEMVQISEDQIVQYQYEPGKQLSINSLGIQNGPSSKPFMVAQFSQKCTCPAGDDSCQRYLARYAEELESSIRTKRPGCNNGTMEPKDMGISLTGRGKDSSIKDGVGYDYDRSNGIVTFRAPPIDPNGSILHPAHFQRILAGACWHKAERLNECQRFTYNVKVDDFPEYACEKKDKLKTALGKPIHCGSIQELLGDQSADWEALKKSR